MQNIKNKSRQKKIRNNGKGIPKCCTPESAWDTARLLIADCIRLGASLIWSGELIGVMYILFFLAIYPLFGMPHLAQGSLCDPTIFPMILHVFSDFPKVLYSHDRGQSISFLQPLKFPYLSLWPNHILWIFLESLLINLFQIFQGNVSPQDTTN